MHKCLLLPEIVRNICDNVPHEKDRPDSSLLALALACRTLLEPALDSLWYDLKDANPILTCLKSADRPETHGFTQVTPLHISILRKYTKRVRIFKSAGIHGAAPNKDMLWSTLYFAVGRENIFPALQYLELELDDVEDWWKLRLCLGPTLTGLRLWGRRGDSGTHQGFLASLLSSMCQETYPRLTEFSLLRCGKVVENTIGWDFISRLQSIRDLDVHVMSPASMDHLSKLKQLQRLRLTVGGYPIDNMVAINYTLDFSCLECCRILCLKIGDCIKYLERLSLEDCLKEVVIETFDGSVSADWNRLSDCLIRKVPTRSLQRLQLRSILPGPRPLEIDLALLATFSGMLQLDLNMSQGLSINDDLIDILARGMPRLQQLSVKWTYSAIPQTTLLALLHLAQHCPQLHSLRLSVDARQPVPRLTANQNPHKSLKSINFGFSPISQPHDVTKFLRQLFPNIDEMGVDQGVDGDLGEMREFETLVGAQVVDVWEGVFRDVLVTSISEGKGTL